MDFSSMKVPFSFLKAKTYLGYYIACYRVDLNRSSDHFGGNGMISLVLTSTLSHNFDQI